MLTTIVVYFGQNSEYEFKVHEAEAQSLTRDDASHWLHEQYEALECAPRNPVGKLLLLDIILDVAKYGGETRFANDAAWAQRYALCCAAALKRDARIDVPNFVVG